MINRIDAIAGHRQRCASGDARRTCRRKQPLRCFAVAVLVAVLHAVAEAHSPLFVIVDASTAEPRLALAPGSLPVLAAEVAMNFAPAGLYAGKFVTDLPGYDATLFPFSQYPGVQLRLERVGFPEGFGMYASAGSTVEVLTADAERSVFNGHTHFVHYAGGPGVYRVHLRYVDAAGLLRPSRVFTIVFRAARSGVDTDEDGVADLTDNCVRQANGDQTDSDGDSVGDACDCCPAVTNRDQRDLDQDGACDVCRCAGEPGTPGDLDCDADVDQKDFAALQTCFTQTPMVLPALHCFLVDFDDDSDVDDDDWDLFVGCASGPAVPADIACLESED